MSSLIRKVTVNGLMYIFALILIFAFLIGSMFLLTDDGDKETRNQRYARLYNDCVKTEFVTISVVGVTHIYDCKGIDTELQLIPKD